MVECDIVHRTTTPLWPQANGEVERQNRTLLKAIKVAQVEKRDWKKELNRFLLAYRSTPHSTTGETPAKSMFGRQIKCKLPVLSEDNQSHHEIRDRDSERKQTVKDFADQKRNVSESDISVGDQVLLRRPRVDKLSAPFHETPFEVVDKYHSQVTVQSPEGVTYKRNSSHVKKFESGQEVTPQVESSEEGSKSEASGGIADDVGIKPSRPVRTRKMPSRFKDFVIDTK